MDVIAWLDGLDTARAAATPGPWRYNPEKVHQFGDEESVFAGPSGNDAICVASTGPMDDPESMADAELIAAAVNALPELTAALRAVLAVHTNEHSGQAAPADPGMCEVCMYEWPCPTVRVATAAVDGGV